MKLYNYSLAEVLFITRGLIDSDGCLTWYWAKDKTFIPNILITLKSNPELLQFIQQHVGGYYTSTNGNWQIRTIKGAKDIGLKILFLSSDSSSCTFVTSRRYDALLFGYVMTQIIERKIYRKTHGKEILIDLRKYLHFGKTRSGSKQSLQLESLLGLPQGSSKDKAKFQAGQMKKEFEAQIQVEQSKILNSQYLNPWQVVGYFLGDGGVHVIWGTKMITTTVAFTGDFRSATGLEIYTESLLRDNNFRKAWKSSKNDSSRLIVHGVSNFVDKIEPFFNNYPPPNCKKK